MKYEDYADKETAYKRGHMHGYETAMQEMKSEVGEVSLLVFIALIEKDKNITYSAAAAEAFAAAESYIEERNDRVKKLKEEHPVHWKDGHKISDKCVLVPEK